MPAATSLYYGESDWLPFVSTSALTASVGLVLALRSRPTASHMGKRDGYLLTALVWVVFSFFWADTISVLFGADDLQRRLL